MKRVFQRLILSVLICFCFLSVQPVQINPGVVKVKDILIYEDPRFYSSFPSVVMRPDGELLLAFRRAPERKGFGEQGTSHVDLNSYLVMVHSSDGETWTKDPDLLYAHPFGGSQDPCLLQMKDGSLLCTSYGWTIVRPDGVTKLKKPFFESEGFIFLGGFILRSPDGGQNWQGPFYPPPVPSEPNFNPFGEYLPAYNRGALFESQDGSILWAAAASDTTGTTTVHLLKSIDKGLTWTYACPVASDSKVSFNETSVYVTPKADIIAFMRTANFGDQACMARSRDGGKTFEKWQSMGFQGHPLNALRLPDSRVLLTYGYRHFPFGIRARVLNAECTDFKETPEIVLRDDGGNGDIGYPWPVLLDRNRILVTYYFNIENGTRHIAGTILEIK